MSSNSNIVMVNNMTKEQIISMIQQLKTKRTAALRTKRGATLEQAAAVDRVARNINSLCDRLALNYNMSNDAPVELQREQASEYLENCVAEAELWLTD